MTRVATKTSIKGGGGGTGSSSAVALTSTQTLTNSSTETVLYSVPVAAGTVSAGQSYRFSWGGSTDHIATSGTLTIRLRIGGTSGITAASHAITSQGSSGSALSFGAEGTLTFRGNFSVSTAFGCNSIARYGIGGTVTSSNTQSAADMTVAQTLDVTAVWQTANAGNTLRLETAFFQLVKV